jgi:hypothetical protein
VQIVNELLKRLVHRGRSSVFRVDKRHLINCAALFPMREQIRNSLIASNQIAAADWREFLMGDADNSDPEIA